MINRMLFGILFATSLLTPGFSQKNDNIWLMGYQATFAPDDSFCVSTFDFSNGSLQVGVNQDIEVFFQETNVSLCDKDGDLQMYTNGVHIFNKNHHKHLKHICCSNFHKPIVIKYSLQSLSPISNFK